MKQENRKLISGLIAAALMTSIFTGCDPDKKETSNGGENISNASTDISSTSTESEESDTSTDESQSTEESTTESASDDNQPSAGEPTTSSDDEPTSEPTTSGDEPSSSQQPSSGSQTPPSSTPEWTETAITQATMYVSVDVANSRTKAIEGAPGVKSYKINDAVTVVAKTNTGYYKLKDGTFIHSDYLSANKVQVQQQTQPQQPSSSNQYTGLTPTDTTGMELDANGFPANPTRGQKFVDKTGQMWQWSRGYSEWLKLGAPSHGSVSPIDPNHDSDKVVGH